MAVRRYTLSLVVLLSAAAVRALELPVTIDYPVDGTIFPPEITAPTFLWRDPAGKAAFWRLEVDSGDGAAPIRAISRGERLRICEIDPRCVSSTNGPPQLTAEQAAARTWTPDEPTWNLMKRNAAGHAATLTITGYAAEDSSIVLSPKKPPL